jgi:hypothetical protein
MPQMLNYIAWQVIPDQVSVPIIGSQPPLYSIRGQISGLLGQVIVSLSNDASRSCAQWD